MKEDLDITPVHPSTSDSALSRPTAQSNDLAQSDRKSSKPVLRTRDQVQRIEIDSTRNASTPQRIITQNRDLQAALETIAQDEATKTAHSIADFPYRLQELINEKVEAYGYDYSDLEAQNQKIRAMWGAE